ncbi:MYND-type domain-containing protein [Mycena venus]|uniref:MYND-type domain-containing protein n=1 Tax=Mycena venus TaxID=2733690 RepID=A0A8H7CR05_9AGAR|nr:MYND-type domain-containing protein [Mycena venus]
MTLGLENLKLLPVSVRRFANPASNGSLPDLERLVRMLEDKDDEEMYRNCLPVFYVNLDPVEIPTEDNLTTDAVQRAILALDGLHEMTDFDPDMSLHRDLWPRIWAWVVFLHAYRECLPPDFAKPDIWVDFVRFLYCFRHSEVVDHTVGVRSLLMDSWSSLLHSTARKPSPSWPALCRIVHDIPVYRPDNLAEILEATGGADGFASIVLRTIKLFFPGPETPVSELALSVFRGLLGFLSNLENSEIVSPALISAGVVGALTSAAVACMSGEGPLHNKDVMVLKSLNVLHRLIPWHRAMCESLAAGLLRLVIHIVALPRPLGPKETVVLQEIVVRTLPSSTVYRTVLTELDIQLQTVDVVDAMDDLDVLHNFTLYGPFESFLRIAYERIAFMKTVDSQETVSRKACDNMQCGLIDEKSKFKRCSHCKSVYYCSPDCQKIDWTHGHREACHSSRAFRFKRDDLGAHNYSFMRALLHRDITEHKYQEFPRLLDPHRLEFMRQTMQKNPSHPLVTIMDYTNGKPTMRVEDVYWQRDEDELRHVHWDDHISRVARGRHGRMELHLMVVLDGPKNWRHVRRLMIPQRSDRPSFREGLVRIFTQPELEGKNDFERIEELRAASGNAVTIH